MIVTQDQLAAAARAYVEAEEAFNTTQQGDPKRKHAGDHLRRYNALVEARGALKQLLGMCPAKADGA